MPKEMPLYRLILEEIRKAYPDKAILSKEEVMKYTGKGEWWADRHGFKGRNGFTREYVADKLARL